MFQRKTKLLMSITLLVVSFTNVKNVFSAYIPDSYNLDDENGGEKQEVDKEDDPSREKISWNEEDGAEEVSNAELQSESKEEWEHIEHTQPLKRSDDPFFTSICNSSGDDVLVGLNKSNPFSKCHCPVNLLYGNNLTVKNYFLVLPRCNMTPEEALEEIKKEQDSDCKLQNISMAKVTVPSIPNKVGSVIFSNQLITSGNTESSLGAAAVGTTSVEGESRTSPGSSATVTSGKPGEKFEGTSSRYETTSTNTIHSSSVNEKVEKAEDMIKTSTTSKHSDEVSSSEGAAHSSTSGEISDSAEAKGGVTVAESGSTSTVRLTLSSREAIELSTQSSLPSQTGDSSTAVPSLHVGDSEAAHGVTPQGTQVTPLDKDQFLRTVDRYCETFNMSDVRTYTIHPVSIAQTLQNYDMQPEGPKSKPQENLAGLKKYKRNSAKRKPRKHVKRWSKREAHKESTVQS